MDVLTCVCFQVTSLGCPTFTEISRMGAMQIRFVGTQFRFDIEVDRVEW
jgi:hypothetical protein